MFQTCQVYACLCHVASLKNSLVIWIKTMSVWWDCDAFVGLVGLKIQDAWRIALAFSSILSNLKVVTSFTWSAIYRATSCKQLRVERQSDYVREFLIAKPHHSWIPPIHLLLLLFLTSWHSHRRCMKMLHQTNSTHNSEFTWPIHHVQRNLHMQKSSKKCWETNKVSKQQNSNWLTVKN